MRLTKDFESKKKYLIQDSYPFIVAIDTREQLPYTFRFDGLEVPVFTTSRTLKSGDYSILGFESKIAVERKSKADFYGSVSSGRERFEREFQRLSRMERACVVVEASQEEILSGYENSQMNPNCVLLTAISWASKYRVPIFFATDRAEAEWQTLEFLRFGWLDFTGSKRKVKKGDSEDDSEKSDS